MTAVIRTSIMILFTVILSSSLISIFNTQTVHAQNAPTEVGGVIDTRALWTQDGSPYIISSTVIITDGGFLVIQPGVVVKSRGDGIVLQGEFTSLSLSGTITNPVIFTSIHDDTRGGDTNANGSQTGPNPGDWAGLIDESSVGFQTSGGPFISLNHVEIHYADIGVDGLSDLFMDNTVIENSQRYGILFANGNPLSNGSSIQNSTISSGPDGLAALSFQNVNFDFANFQVNNNNIQADSGVAVELSGSTSIRLQDNRIVQASDKDAITIIGGGDTIQMSGMAITRTVINTDSVPLSVGIAVTNSNPLVIESSIANFSAPFRLDGYPQTAVLADANRYINNSYSGIALSGRLTSGSWDNSTELPYFIWIDDLKLDDNGKLSIPAGTIIKSAGGAIKLGNGSALTAQSQGTQTGGELPIVFTSIKDDSAGGDMNNDGGGSAPEPGDWGGLDAPGSDVTTANQSTMLLQNIQIRFATIGISSSGNVSLVDSLIDSSLFENLLLTAPNGSANQIVMQGNTIETSINAANVWLRGQPSQFVMSNNRLSCVSTHCLYLRDVETGDMLNNNLSHSGGANSATFFQDVGNQFLVSGNNIQHFGTPAQAGLAFANSSPQLITNTVGGFNVAVWVEGFPASSPSYQENIFINNNYDGVALGQKLTAGTWNNVGGYNHFLWTNDLVLERGATLTIPAGQTMYSAGGGIIVEAGATLNAIGTVEEPITFTSISPANVNSGDTRHLATRSTNSEPHFSSSGHLSTAEVKASGALTIGDWTGLIGNGASAGGDSNSTLDLQNVEIRLATTGIRTSGNLTLTNSLLEGNHFYDVSLMPNPDQPANILIENNQFRNTDVGFATNLYLNGEPNSLTVQNNTIESTRAFAIRLASVSNGQIANNQISQRSSLNPAVYIQNVGEQVILSGNTITRLQGAASTGILSERSRALLADNSVSGFEAAISVDGFPQIVPTYSNNSLDGNTYTGVAIIGELTGGIWESPSSLAHFIWTDDLVLPSGQTLAIPAGQIIKSVAGALIVQEGSALNAIGTDLAPIVITSIKDDAYGGDSNNDGAQSEPDAGDWGGIQTTTSTATIAEPASLNLDNVLTRYAETGLDSHGNLSLTDSIVEFSNVQALQIAPPVTTTTSVSLQRSILRYSVLDGLGVEQLPSELSLKNNAIYGNGRFGLRDATGTLGPIDATGIWWGDAVGPKEDPTEAKGIGDVVIGNVNFAEWLTSPPSYVVDAPPILPPTEPLTPTQPITPTVDPPPPIIPPPSQESSVDDFEDNNTCADATILEPNGALQEHSFHVANDVDWIRFVATAGQNYRIEVQTRANSTADVDLEVYGQCGGAVDDQFNASFTPGVRLDFEAATDGPIFLKLNNAESDRFGEDAVYAISVNPLITAQTQQARGAVILMEGRLKVPDRLQPNIFNVISEAYDLFRSRGYDDDNIFYMSIDPEAKGVDAPATAANLREALINWAPSRVGPDQPLTIYIMDHGNVDLLYVDEPIGERVSPEQLHQWLATLEAAQPNVKTTIVVEACHSGSFIEGTQSVSRAGRVVISSTNVENVAYASAQGAQFSDRFLVSLREGFGISSSFWDARQSVRQLYRIQDPWIDVNGNGIPNEQSDLEQATEEHNPGNGNQRADFWAPYIVNVEGPRRIVDGRGTIRAEVRDNKGVRRVWGVVYPPSYAAPTTVEELVPEDVPTFDFVLHGNDIYGTEYTNFTEKGTYRIAIFAEDTDRLKARLRVIEVSTDTNINPVFLPFVPK